MESLKHIIIQKGAVVNEQVLDLDEVLNHQVEPKLMMEIGRFFAEKFQDEGITKVVTIESSGISVAFATASVLDVPMIFARRKRPLHDENDFLCERVPSFTKGIVTDIVIARHLLSPDDRILLIDDIIANGDAARGLIRIIERSEAKLAGVGIVVEKSFQAGASSIREMGYRFESVVNIRSLENNQIHFG